MDKYEEGDLEPLEIVRMFQELVDTGKVWEMSAQYVNEALALINMGLVKYTPETGEEND